MATTRARAPLERCASPGERPGIFRHGTTRGLHDTDRYHDRFTAVPVEQARQALREFCRTGGGRPTSVSWVAGDYYGRIIERLTVATRAA
ncbi:Imm1 family immunity protein [Actinopolyspora saharensis]|uniref:Imm1 family immunity protein n=1 Tax=Actinopolyspora saharensis TaxID=995062 RepID=UPI003F66BE29